VEKCLVCSHEFTRDGNRCPRCQWPIGFGSVTRDPRTDADVVNWAAMMYKKLLKLYEQQQVVTSNVSSAAPEVSTSDVTLLEARVQQLTAELHTFNSAYIQERHRYNRKIDELTKEVEFCKDIIQTNQESVEKIANLERQYQEISQRLISQAHLVSPLPQPGLPLAATRDEPLQPEPARSQPTSLPVFEIIPEQLQLPEIKVPISPAERDLLDFYNRFPDIPEHIRQDAIDVSIDQNALNRLRDGDTSQVTFASDRKGNFLVVRLGGYQYLVPNKKRPINSLIHKTVKAIYTCEGYHENYEQFTLVRPALVEEVATDRWQLGQKGVLKFK
jgi:hypothetical protein